MELNRTCRRHPIRHEAPPARANFDRQRGYPNPTPSGSTPMSVPSLRRESCHCLTGRPSALCAHSALLRPGKQYRMTIPRPLLPDRSSGTSLGQSRAPGVRFVTGHVQGCTTTLLSFERTSSQVLRLGTGFYLRHRSNSYAPLVSHQVGTQNAECAATRRESCERIRFFDSTKFNHPGGLTGASGNFGALVLVVP